MSNLKEKPILFSTPMVKAILKNRKTQTRRIIQNPTNIKDFFFIDEQQAYPFYYRNRNGVWDSFQTMAELIAKRCPYKIGQKLWVRETFMEKVDIGLGHNFYEYKATPSNWQSAPNLGDTNWKPSIFMPRIASRITLEITNIRVERIQDISNTDAIREGIPDYPDFEGDCPVDDFRELWDKINAKRGFGWAENPFVWVIEFKELSKCAE